MFADQLKKYMSTYLKAVAITAPATIAMAANNVKDAFKEGRNVLPELGIGVTDVASCGVVSVGRGIAAVLAARKASTPVTESPVTPIAAVLAAPAVVTEQPAEQAEHLTAAAAKKVDSKPHDKLVDPAK